MRCCGVAAVLVAVAVAALATTGQPTHAQTRIAAPAPTGTNCVGSNPPASARIPWRRLHNPVLAYPDVAIKDGPVILGPNGWYVAYSRITETPFRFVLGAVTTPDFLTFTEQPPVDDPATGGLASPEIVRRADGTFVETFNSHTRDVDGANKLYYRTSKDLEHWSPGRRIHVIEHDAPTDRLIDAALARANGVWFLGYKLGQSFRVARAPTLDGPWHEIGAPTTGLLENYEFIRIDSTWHLLGTTWTPKGAVFVGGHWPVLFRMQGDPVKSKSWATWRKVSELEIPSEAWNHADGPPETFEVANAAYLCDARPLDGHFYVIYSGSTEVLSYSGRGHAMVGIARSTDLVHWDVPPGATTDPADATDP